MYMYIDSLERGAAEFQFHEYVAPSHDIKTAETTHELHVPFYLIFSDLF